MSRGRALAKRIGPIGDDTIGYALERQSPEPGFALSCEIARRLKRNRVLRSGRFPGLVVAAVDGKRIQYYRRIVVVAAVSTPFPSPLGLRFQKHGEGEVACALAPPEVDRPVAGRSVRVVKTVRIEHLRRVTVTGKDGHRIKTKTPVTQESTNFYATNLELGSAAPWFIHQFGRSRWRIDTEVFQTITTGFHLKHPAVHQTTALVALTMIRFLAYTLSPIFYHRQVRSQPRGKCETFHECAKRIAYWFVAPAANTS